MGQVLSFILECVHAFRHPQPLVPPGPNMPEENEAPDLPQGDNGEVQIPPEVIAPISLSKSLRGLEQVLPLEE
ncbi:hypothetical protein FRC08_018616 [Ceratobasidium sp. 394]|nr:hypothetical protein FRC08_018616 [Ceratobasidium sp. 394]